MTKTIKKQVLVTDEIASVRNDIFYDYIGNVVLNPDKVLKSESGGKGIELYDDLLRDPQVRSTLQTRKLAVIGREWEIIPASDNAQDIKIAEFVKEVLLGFNYDAARHALLSGIVLGYKPAEVMWEYSEGDVWVKDIIGKAPRRFVFDLDGKLRLLTLQNMIEGEAVPERKFVVFRNVSANGSYYGDGLGSSLYWPVWFKKNAVKFWLIFAEKFGSPTAIGKYPCGTPGDKQTKLLETLETIQQESCVTIPDTMMVEFLEAERSGTINTYESLYKHLNSEISKIILGQTLTTEVGDKGSYAASETHNDVRQEYIKADADALCECQNNSLIRWIVDYNFPGVTVYPKVWIRTEQEQDLKPLAERDRILVREIGLPVSKKYFYETYGIPQPEEGDELVEIPSSAVFPPPTPASGGQQGENMKFAEYAKRCQHCFADAEEFTPEQRAIESLVSKTIPEASKALEGNEKKILDAVLSSSSYEEAMARLLELYPEIDTGKLREFLERSIFQADVFGRYTVRENERD